MVSDCSVYYRHNMHVKIWWWCSWLSKLGPMLIARGLKVQFPRLAQSYRVAFKPDTNLSTVWLASLFNRNNWCESQNNYSSNDFLVWKYFQEKHRSTPKTATLSQLYGYYTVTPSTTPNLRFGKPSKIYNKKKNRKGFQASLVNDLM